MKLISIWPENYDESVLGIEIDPQLFEIRIQYVDLSSETHKFTKEEFEEDKFQVKFY